MCTCMISDHLFLVRPQLQEPLHLPPSSFSATPCFVFSNISSLGCFSQGTQKRQKVGLRKLGNAVGCHRQDVYGLHRERGRGDISIQKDSFLTTLPSSSSDPPFQAACENWQVLKSRTTMNGGQSNLDCTSPARVRALDLPLFPLLFPLRSPG